MSIAGVDYTENYKNLFRERVIPVAKNEIKTVETLKNRRESLSERLQQNEVELEALNKDLQKLRTESVDYVISEKKGDEYIQKLSKIKGRTALVEAAQEEIQTYLLPEVERQLDAAYSELVKVADQVCAEISNQAKGEIFEAVENENNKTEGFYYALLFLNDELKLPQPHRLDFENCPGFPDLNELIKKGKWWGKKLLN